ncbi:MAG: hypothetical protein HUK01_05565 [Bacteroidaceae bacterium]|nr:hypothetical protein [Bacteroidaceae bacterium]
MNKKYMAPGVAVVGVRMTAIIAESIDNTPDDMDSTLHETPSGNPQLVREWEGVMEGEEW